MYVFDYFEELFQPVWGYNDLNKALISLLAGFGLLLALYLFLKFIIETHRIIQLYIFSQFCCKSDLKSKYGKWAIVTGATDGIGLAFARELAKRGHSIIIISRNEHKLAKTKLELDQVANVGETLTIQADFTDSSPENYDRIRKLLDADNRDIGILVNNVGMCPPTNCRIHRCAESDLRAIVNVNVFPALLFTRMVIPGMLRRQKGLIINLSSLFAIMPIPYLHYYPATKSFITTFSAVLRKEFANDPIDVVNLTPGTVQTKMVTDMSESFVHRNVNPFCPAPDDFARTALNATSAGYSNYSGCLMHDIFESFMAVPLFLWLYVTLFVPFMKYNGTDYQVSPKFNRKSYSLKA